jgi:HlyD family secretion protein
VRRFLFPIIGVVAAIWATYSIVRTTPLREATEPPAPAPISEYEERVAAVGLVEASTENISIGTPLSGIVTRVFVAAGHRVTRGQPLFELDTRHLAADLDARQQSLGVARARVGVAEARLHDLERQLGFVEQVTDPRAVSAEERSRRRSAVETAAAELSQAQAEVAAGEAQVRTIQTELDRSTIRAPLDADVLQVRLRPGEYAPAAATVRPLILLGRLTTLHVRVDVDEHESWRIRAGAPAVGHVRGNPDLRTPLTFVRFEPFVVPKTSLTGDSTERVDTRVLQLIYRVDRSALPLFVGQQLDVFVDATPAQVARQ